MHLTIAFCLITKTAYSFNLQSLVGFLKATSELRPGFLPGVNIPHTLPRGSALSPGSLPILDEGVSSAPQARAQRWGL